MFMFILNTYLMVAGILVTLFLVAAGIGLGIRWGLGDGRAKPPLGERRMDTGVPF